MGFLKKIGKRIAMGLVGIVASAIMPLLSCLRLRRNVKLHSQNGRCGNNRMSKWLADDDKGGYVGRENLEIGHAVSENYIVASLLSLGSCILISGGIVVTSFTPESPALALISACGSIIFITLGSSYPLVMAFFFGLDPKLAYSFLNDICLFFPGKNRKDSFGNTALHRAIHRIDLSDVRDLVVTGSDLTIRDNGDFEYSDGQAIPTPPRTPVDLSDEVASYRFLSSDRLYNAREINQVVISGICNAILFRWPKYSAQIFTIFEETVTACNNTKARDPGTIILSYYGIDDFLNRQIPLFLNYESRQKAFFGRKGPLIFSKVFRPPDTVAQIALEMETENPQAVAAASEVHPNGYVRLSEISG